MLQLDGNPGSRALRCLWREIGQPYRLVDKSFRADDLHNGDYLRPRSDGSTPACRGLPMREPARRASDHLT